MSAAKSIHTVVLDTGPILQNNPTISTLLSKSDSLVTTPSVISEIKDVDARSLFDTTFQPFLSIQTPSPLSVKFVTGFARKTGDLAVLSRTDVEIIALAYELERHRNEGDWRLPRRPSQKGFNSSTKDNMLDKPKDPKAIDLEPEPAKAPRPTTAAPWAKTIFSPAITEIADQETVERRDRVDTRSEDLDGPEVLAGEISGPFNNLSIRGAESESAPVVDRNPEKPSGMSASHHDAEDSESEESEGWITPSNIKKVQAAENDSSTCAISPETTMHVAIITTDFAMQNVILQIGLNLLSPNLQRIYNIRNYILRCHACFQIVKDTSNQFCPRCGKPTLTRVSCSTNAKGEFKIHLKKSMRWNHRGDRYSIPKPVPGKANGKVGQGKGGGKGGWGQDLILAEDQKEYQRAMGLNRKAKGTDLMDEDYLPGILTGVRGRAAGRPKVGAGRNVNSTKRL